MAAKVRKTKKHFRLDIIWDVDDEVSEIAYHDLSHMFMALDNAVAAKGVIPPKYPCFLAMEEDLTDKQADRIYDSLTKE